MSENNQIQQNNLIQNQQQIQDSGQQIIQQNIQKSEETKPQIKKKHSSLLTKVVSGIFFLLGIALILVGISEILRLSSDGYYSTREIITNIGSLIFNFSGIGFILLGILSYRTPDINIYYHPTLLTKILSGIYRFIGIALIRAGLWNFSLIGTENLSFLKILYVGGIITLCGILYILLGRLLYCTKSRIHLGFSLLCALAVNIMFLRILIPYTDDSHILNSLGYVIVIFTPIYFSILTIRWIIKCHKFYKKGIIDSKYLDSTPSKKKIGIIITIILFLIVVINLIYGKIQWSKIPEIDEAIFSREEHQVKLPDEEDALVQLRNYMKNLPDLFQKLDGITLNTLDDKEIGWQSHQDECIPVYSGGNSYCGTRVYSRKTIYRLLNQYLDENNYYEKSNEIQNNNEKKITLMEYLDEHNSEIKNTFSELDHILGMDYYIPTNEYIGIFPAESQGFARASTILLQYYIWNKDWDMIKLIIKVNYEIIDVANHIGGGIYTLTSIALQGIISDNINSSIKLLPKDTRIEILNLINEKIYNRQDMIHEMVKGEYVIRNRAKSIGILDDFGVNKPSLKQFLFHFPFYSYKDTERLMLYTYSMIYNEDFNENNFEENIIGNGLSIHNLIYNHYGRRIYRNLTPRFSSFIQRLNYSIERNNALINNLKYGEYKKQFNELYWNFNSSIYEEYLLTEK